MQEGEKALFCVLCTVYCTFNMVGDSSPPPPPIPTGARGGPRPHGLVSPHGRGPAGRRGFCIWDRGRVSFSAHTHTMAAVVSELIGQTDLAAVGKKARESPLAATSIL